MKNLQLKVKKKDRISAENISCEFTNMLLSSANQF